jgi:diguanylate cyclase (GGDEF)-like protein/PAS domain S-box-containing protein
MSRKSKTKKELEIENNVLREQLEEAENTLRAIQEGSVDAFVVSKSGNTQVLTLRESDYLYRVFVESMNEGAVTLVPDGTIFYTNKRFAEIVQKPVEKLIGASFYELTATNEENNKELKEGLGGKKSLRVESHLLSGKFDKVPVEISAHALEAEDIKGFCIVVTDITERKQANENLRYLSSHDILTGLYNRNYFEEEMARLEKGRQYPISVIVIDIDGLKRINDLFGHSAGDDLIKRVAVILKEVFRADDIIARIGGDEFAVLLPNVNIIIANQLVNRIKKNLENHNAIQQGPLLMFSLGTAAAEKNEILSEVFKRADNEMYLNKQERKK